MLNTVINDKPTISDSITKNWTEQALEWAQRISNGETWESICDNSDTANCLRLVAWENNYYRLIGDSGNWKNKKPPTRIGSSCKIDTRLSSTVPLVAFKKKFPF